MRFNPRQTVVSLKDIESALLSCWLQIADDVLNAQGVADLPVQDVREVVADRFNSPLGTMEQQVYCKLPESQQQEILTRAFPNEFYG